MLLPTPATSRCFAAGPLIRKLWLPETPHIRRSFATKPAASSPSTNGPDIIVVGSGLAGMSAAIAARQRGASVLVLDRAYGGGTSALSGGVVYAGGGTRQQREAGIHHDTPANLLAYLQREVGSSGVVDDATLRRFCDGSVERLEWLESLGVEFSSSLCPYKTAYPTHRHFLYYSGNEKATGYAELAAPAPRGHRAVAEGFGGKAIMKAMLGSAESMGVQLQPATKVEKVLTDGSGRAIGVKYRVLKEGAPGFEKHRKLTTTALGLQIAMRPLADWYTRRAQAIFDRHAEPAEARAGAVILAAGGFAINDAVTAKHIPEFSQFLPMGTSGDDGSGIQLGLGVGGSVSQMDRFSAWRFLSPPTAFLEGVAVSRAGVRIAAEDTYGATFSEVFVKNHEGKGFVIIDSRQFAKAKSQVKEQSDFPYRIHPLKQIYLTRRKAPSLDALALKIGATPAQLEATVGAYNEAIQLGRADPVGKTDEYRSPILEPPFYAVDISIEKSGPSMVLGMTLGGLRVDGETGLVISADDAPIPGLYAAGRTAVGVCSNGYVSGLSLADCVFSGKRAGEHAALSVGQGREA